MSQIVTTDLGRFRRVKSDAGDAWLWECRCGEWATLSDDQWHGRVSVNHASMGCPSGYHETHDYAAELLAVMQVRILTGRAPIDAPGETP